jgi:hypothetical protein
MEIDCVNQSESKQTSGEETGVLKQDANIRNANKTLKSLQFQNPGSKFSSEVCGKRKIKSTNRFDINVSV